MVRGGLATFFLLTHIVAPENSLWYYYLLMITSLTSIFNIQVTLLRRHRIFDYLVLTVLCLFVGIMISIR